jgi:hypothetical protein
MKTTPKNKKNLFNNAFFFLCLLSNCLFAQVSNVSKGKIKLALKYTTFINTDSVQIPVLRYPASKVDGRAQHLILRLQDSLERAKNNYLANKMTFLSPATTPNFIRWIQDADLKWYLDHYITEANFYHTNDSRIKQRLLFEKIKRNHIEDSLRKLDIAQKEKERDSLEFIERVRGWHFANFDKLPIYSDSSKKSKIIGLIDAASYVKVISKSKSGFLKVSVGYEGFVEEKYIVDDINKITIKTKKLEIARKKKFVSTIEQLPDEINNPDNKFTNSTMPRVKNKKHATGPRIKDKKYIIGPRGGCYYINSSGKKVYVDHSFCH